MALERQVGSLERNPGKIGSNHNALRAIEAIAPGHDREKTLVFRMHKWSPRITITREPGIAFGG